MGKRSAVGAAKKAVAAGLLAAQVLSGSAAPSPVARKEQAQRAVERDDTKYSRVAEGYCRDVVSGVIPACLYIRLACQEHLNDLQAQTREDVEWRYDPAKAERVCRYVEMFPHIKGEWAIRRETLVLAPWMVFATCRLFGMVSKDTGLRRFREFYAEVPRKNAKTTLTAAWMHYLAFHDGEYAAEVYIGASKMEQALIAFTTASRQLEMSGAARSFGLVIGKRQIFRPRDGSFIRAVAKRPGDGGSPHAALLDELHEHERADLRDSMQQGFGARLQPLLVQITTAGSDIQSVCYGVRATAVSVLQGTQKDDQLFALIYTIDQDDDPLSEGAFVKANPNLGISVKAKDLDTERLRAKQNPSLAFTFRTKKLNVWGQSRNTFFNVDAWMHRCFDPALVPVDPKTGKPTRRNPGIPERFKGKEWSCVEGQDLAARQDLASRVKIFTKNEGATEKRASGRHYYVFGTHYAPEMKVNDGQHTATYVDWEGHGWLTAHAGYEIDLAAIRDAIIADFREYKTTALAFDPAFARQMQQEIEKAVGEGIVWDIPQNAREISDGMKEFAAAIVSGRVHHNGDPVLTAAISNVVSKPDPNENEYPRKERPENKIDPVSALLNGMNRVMATAEPTSVPYRGLGSV